MARSELDANVFLFIVFFCLFFFRLITADLRRRRLGNRFRRREDVDAWMSGALREKDLFSSLFFFSFLLFFGVQRDS